MTQFTQTGLERRQLRSQAQKLHPVARIGHNGIDPVLPNVQTALHHHPLIKIRFDALKDQKKELALLLADKTGSELVQVIGHHAVLYRPR